MIRIVVDIEADGPIIGYHSMISFGVVVLDDKLNKTFYRELKPIGDNYVPDALKVSGFSRKQTLSFEEPEKIMKEFEAWLKEINPNEDRIHFWSDNNGFDFPWMQWYCLTFLGYNPLGHSSNNIRNIYNGMTKDMKKSFKFLRKTKHTHNALDDAIGNAEALLSIAKMGMKGIL